MSTRSRAGELAAEIEAAISELPVPDTKALRGVRFRYSRRLRDEDGQLILETARRLRRNRDRTWLAFELIRYHEGALGQIGAPELLELGQGMASWHDVDCFAGYLAGPAWLRGQINDELVHAWARSEDRWWRRAALVATVVLNTPSHGGRGDVERTLVVCGMLVEDRDDMVVKGLSWALRKLVAHDSEAVEGFLDEHAAVLAARVRREVGNKLTTGLKNPRRGVAGSRMRRSP